MRAKHLMAICLTLAAVLLASAQTVRADSLIEPGIDRAGGDYRSFDIGNADLRDTPELVCRDACRKESQCRAWTYVKIGVQGPKARCWLKTSVPAPRLSNCCISGSR